MDGAQFAKMLSDKHLFLRGAGGKLRETIQNLFQTPFEGNHGRRFYISAKRSTQMNRKTTKKVDELIWLCWSVWL